MVTATDLRTKEQRLLSKRRLGSFYLDDVRALIAEREAARAACAGMLSLYDLRRRGLTPNGEWESAILADARTHAEAGADI